MVDSHFSGRVLVTGASGFVGRNLCSKLRFSGINHVRVQRSGVDKLDGCLIIPNFSEFSGWEGVLSGVEVVVHLAGRAHILKESSSSPLEDFRRANVEPSVCLARCASQAGVKRFVFMSSIGVNGDFTERGVLFSATSAVCPRSPYAISKYEAELALAEISEITGMEMVIVRAPMVYGPDAPGNFRSMLKFVASGIPLPFGAIDKNRRTLISIQNLVDFLMLCIRRPSPTCGKFLVGDGQDVSTADLLVTVGKAMGKSPYLFNVNPLVLRFLMKLVRREDYIRKLLCDLRVDISETCRALDWSPPTSVWDGLANAVRHEANI